MAYIFLLSHNTWNLYLTSEAHNILCERRACTIRTSETFEEAMYFSMSFANMHREAHI